MSKFAELLNEAGQKPSTVNAALNRIVEHLESARPAFQQHPRLSLALEQAMIAHDANNKLGSALASLDEFRKAQETAKPTPGLKPGQKIGDVGGNEDDPQYSGAIDPATLTRENWAYYQARNLGHLASTIFSGRQSGMNAALAKYHGGDLTANVVPDAGPLAQFG